MNVLEHYHSQETIFLITTFLPYKFFSKNNQVPLSSYNLAKGDEVIVYGVSLNKKIIIIINSVFTFDSLSSVCHCLGHAMQLFNV